MDEDGQVDGHAGDRARRTVLTAIEAAKRDRRGALIAYLPVGFPDLATSIDAAVALGESGVDAIEFGLPYSDPVMDGPVIQAATTSALANGFRVNDLFVAISRVTERVKVPILAMSYWNLILQHGPEEFARDLAQAGGVGTITPDLVPDEGEAWIAAAESHGLDHVFLAAPSSSDERIAIIVRASTGFVYAVSTMGVTGTRAEVDRAARTLTGRLKHAGAPAACVGIGVSTAAQVADVLGYADGAIVGSALVAALADGGPRAVERLAAELMAGTR